MTGTIIKAVRALEKAGHTELANELHAKVETMTTNIDNLTKNVNKQQRTMKKYVHMVQSRCNHPEWHLVKDSKDEIGCYVCGHTVCDLRMFQFWEDVLGTFRIQYRAMRDGTVRSGKYFTLSGAQRKSLGDKLVAKEIDDEEGTGNVPAGGQD